jgi:hypothetical protein
MFTKKNPSLRAQDRVSITQELIKIMKGAYHVKNKLKTSPNKGISYDRGLMGNHRQICGVNHQMTTSKLDQ